MRFRTWMQVLAALVGLTIASLVIYHCRQAHLWPFSTGSKDAAFLGAPFGMSKEEVARALKRYHAQLLNYDDYRRSEIAPMITESFDIRPWLNSDERDVYSMYMPSIEMFGAIAEAEFEFHESKLSYVTAHFMDQPHAARLVDSVVATLKKHYRFVSREETKNVAGAYSLHFASQSVAPSLWVNLTDAKKPVITLSLKRISAEADRRREIELREQSAFGQ